MKVSPIARSESSFKVKRSEFIGFLDHISKTEHVNGNLKILKKEYHSARHICWAYRLDSGNELTENSSDGGEPSGSAGLPILNTLRKNRIVNGAVFVIRYFGGVKLGKRGLIDAYKKCAEIAVEQASLKQWKQKKNYQIECPLDYYGNLSNHLDKYKGKIVRDESKSSLSWQIDLPEGRVKHFCKEVELITEGNAVCHLEDVTN